MAGRPPPPLSPTGEHQSFVFELPNVSWIYCEVVHDADAVRANPRDCLVVGFFGLALEPGGRTPGVLLRLTHQTMPRRIAVDIVQPREIGALVSQMRIPILKPDSASRRLILSIDFPGSDRMEMADESRKSCGLAGRNSHEMIVIGEDSPSLEFPLV